MAKAKVINVLVSFWNVENQLQILSSDVAQHKSASQFCFESMPQVHADMLDQSGKCPHGAVNTPASYLGKRFLPRSIQSELQHGLVSLDVSCDIYSETGRLSLFVSLSHVMESQAC